MPEVAPNPHIPELVTAAQSALGFVFGLRIEAERAKADLAPIIPEKFLQVAAQKIFGRLERAVQAYNLAEQMTTDSVNAVNVTGKLMRKFKL